MYLSNQEKRLAYTAVNNWKIFKKDQVIIFSMRTKEYGVRKVDWPSDTQVTLYSWTEALATFEQVLRLE